MKLDNNTKLELLFLTLLSLVILGFNPGGRDLWAPDEPRYAEIAREMWNGSGFFLPHLNGETYCDKPPGFFWLILLFSLPAGEVNMITPRLPSIFLGTATLVILFLWVKKYQRKIPPLAAPLILLTSYLFWWFGGRANIDISFTFFITAAALSFYHGYREYGGGFSPFYIPAYLALGAGLIIKGPFALFPLAVMIIFFLIRRDRTAILRLRIPLGIILTMIPVAVWLIPAGMEGGWIYLQRSVLGQIGPRLADSPSHPHPFYFYLYMLPLNFMPWSIFLLVVLLGIARKKILPDTGLKFCLIWAGTIFLAISLVSAKQSHYLLPLFPALAVITARFLTLPEKKGAGAAALITFGLLLAMAIGAPLWVGRKFPQYFLPALSCGIILGISVLFGIRSIASGKYTNLRLFNHLCLSVCLLFIGANLWILPALNRRKSPRFILQPYIAEESDLPFAVYCRPSDWSFNYPFFLKNYVLKLFTPEEVIKYARSPGKRYLLARKEYFSELPPALRENFRILRERKVGHRELLLLLSGENEK